ncbi:tripartite tricarboxylate transporter substrate binding protein [Candidimonas humi]|uniref:Bug family tripartite tricarboxylate transporter substrate binding protein n=1 Tax=Candidimonas humi TaxID=683355 RepID=A0ABV8NYD5_9BURK|nr:tripartite tricarboxylate transporter substrate binding protein [Candidimonas humi]MBV6304154.1 tripartite tricarboxylate transporter substrate binding protein [Candidimonas humi]
MHSISRRIWMVRAAACAVFSVACVSAPAAAAYPDRPVKLTVPYPAGGTADLLGRILAQRLSQAWGQPVIVENKSGAGGAIGVETVAKSRPDGYNLVLGVTGALTIAPHLRKLPYDPVKDLAPISLVGSAPNLLAVTPSLPVKSVPELIAYAKAHPGKVSFSSAGVGTSVHIASELFAHMAGIKILHVPYKGDAPSVQALLTGDVSMTIGNLPVLKPYVKSGQIRALAVSSAARTAAAPGVPAIAETLPGYQVTTWFGLFAPAGTSEAVLQKIQAGVATALQSPDVKAQLERLGIDAVGSTPAELANYVAAESKRFGEVIRSAGIHVN